MPKFNSISISGYHMQEAGATQDLELAYTLADGIEYIRAGVAAGMNVDQFAPRLSFFWAIGTNFFMEIAKMRAARKLWAGIVKGFGAKVRQVAAAAHPQPDFGLVADRAGPRQQHRPHPDRGDGGDARAYPVPAHERARRGDRVADAVLGPHRPQHPALPHRGERHDQIIDPWGGSYYVERLTAELAQRAQTHIDEIQSLGGMAKAIEQGVPKRRIEEAAARTQARIDSGRQTVIGVNAFHPNVEREINVLKVDAGEVRAMQIEKLKRSAPSGTRRRLKPRSTR